MYSANPLTSTFSDCQRINITTFLALLNILLCCLLKKKNRKKDITKIRLVWRRAPSCCLADFEIANSISLGSWVFKGVYGPTKRGSREERWEDLGAVMGLWGDPWCLGGDFNIIRFLRERN